MTDKPQLMTEEIEMIPHPMDAWRAALNALIACAPGDSAAIAVHLGEARQQALVFVDRTAATEGTRQLVDRLMLIGAGRIVGDRLQAQSAPATVAAINRRVTARLTVVVNGTDYDVSRMPGVMVGDMIRVDPNNMPPVLKRDAFGLGYEQQKVHLLAAATRANGKCLLTDREAEIISQDLVAGVRQHRAEPQSSPSSCAATAAQNGQCTSHQGQRKAHQCAVAAPLPSIEPAPLEPPASPQSPSRAAHVAQRFLAVDPDRS